MKTYELDSGGAGVLFICTDSKKILLLERSSYVSMSGYWALPGGSTDLGETPIETAVREVDEEIHINIDPSKLKLIYKNVVDFPKFTFYNFCYFVDHEFIPRLNWEHTQYGWFDFNDLPSPLHFGVQQLLKNQEAKIKVKKYLSSEIS